MTDRFAGFVVVLAKDLREDDAQASIAAIRQIKGVIDVEPITSSIDTQLAQTRIRIDVRRKLYDAIDEALR